MANFVSRKNCLKGCKFSSVLILFGCFVLEFISDGMAMSFGILYTELVHYFEAPKSLTSWIPSIGSGFMLLFGPAAGFAVEKLGIRTVAITGSILTAAGLTSSSFVSSIYLLYLTYGTAAGIGFCLIYLASTCSLNINFTKRRSLAAGISKSGVGISATVIPILSNYLIDLYGWRGAFLILAGVALQAVCCGLIITTKGAKSIKEKSAEVQNQEKTITSNGRLSSRTDVSRRMTWSDLPSLPQNETMSAKIKKTLRSRQFNLVTISGAFVFMVLYVPYFMLPDMVIGLGVSRNSAALMLTVAGVTSIIARVVSGFISDFPCVNKLIMNGFWLILLGAATCLCSQVQDEYLFYIYSIILGLVTGTFSAFQIVIAADIVGKDIIGIAFGYQSFFGGIGIIIGPPFAGYLADLTGDYKMSFIFAGVFLCLGGIFSIMAYKKGSCIKVIKEYPLNSTQDVSTSATIPSFRQHVYEQDI